MLEIFGGYRPIELSDPAYERDEVRSLTFYSQALGGRGDVSLFVPHEADGRTSVPLVLLLHGVYGSHWSWFYSGASHLAARRLIDAGRIRPMLLVCPSDGLAGDGSGYLPQPGRNYEAWICEDVLGCVRELFPGTSGGAAFLSGLSMGGYGALRLGAKYPDRFQGISAHSAITNIEELDHFVRKPVDRSRLAPEEPDILYWMHRNKGKLPPIRMDCGREDDLFETNRAFHETLVREGISHEFVSNVGDHSWSYWRNQVEETLLFFESILRSES